MSDAEDVEVEAAFEDMLINAVYLREYLYDKKHPDHSKRMKVRRAWQDIAEDVGKGVDICKTRWRSLRDRYLKIQRELRTNTPSGSGQLEDVLWPYYSQLSFLDDHEELRITFDSLQEEGDASAGPSHPSQDLDSSNGESLDTNIPSTSSSSVQLSGRNMLQSCSTPEPTPSVHANERPPQVFTRGQTPKASQFANAINKLGSIFEAQIEHDKSLVQKRTTAIAAFATFIERSLEKMSESDQDETCSEIMEIVVRKKRRSSADVEINSE